MKQFVYLDHNATTPLDSEVLAEMMPFLTDEFGNSSSVTHRWGRTASAAIDRAREQVSQAISAEHADEIIFTSGATESINLALQGIFHRYSLKGKHYITSKAEHKAVLETFSYLERLGAEVTYLDVDRNGQISLEELEKNFRKDSVLLALMSSNNETGVIHPIHEYAKLAHAHDVLFFCDATQSIGKTSIDLREIPIDLLCLSAHKFYGPKGVGALFVRRKSKRIQLESLIHGGSQEKRRRGGTLNVPGIVGLGAALNRSIVRSDAEQSRLMKLRSSMEAAFLKLPQVYINGGASERLAHVSNICFRHVPASLLMGKLPELGLSSGSACVSGDREPSHVLISMGSTIEDAHASIRISMGKNTTEEQVNYAVEKICKTVSQIRNESPTWLLFQKGLLD